MPDTATQPAAASPDAELLRAIASAKDRDAFDELHRRYVTPCYNLALNIAGQRETAEEAVQDAMLRIWRFAGGFKPGGNARGWIMQTLAHSCIAVLKKNAAERKRERDAAEPLPPAPAQDGAARDELLLALRTAVARLPEAERRIVALYFGAELSQAEIGKELDISQRNVSGRLTRALESLRHDLAQGGFAAAAPLLGKDLCAQALTAGQTVPPGLDAAIRARLADGAAQESLRGAAHGGSVLVQALVVLAAALALGIAAYAWMSIESQAPMQAQQAAPHAAASAGSATIKEAPESDAGAASAPVHRDWTFEKGVPDGLELISGEWTWHAPSGKLPGHVTAVDDAWALLKAKIPPRPMRVRFEFCRIANEASRGEYGISWIHGRTVPARKFYEVKSNQKFSERRMVIDLYLWGRFAVSTCQGHLNSLLAYDAPYPSSALVLSFANFGISRLTLDELAEDEIPAPVRNAVERRDERRSYTRPAVVLEPLKD